MSRVKSNISKFHMYLELAKVFAHFFAVAVDTLKGSRFLYFIVIMYDRFFKVAQNYLDHFNISVGKCRVIYCGINL